MKRDWSNIDKNAVQALLKSRFLLRTQQLRKNFPSALSQTPPSGDVLSFLGTLGGTWLYHPHDKMFSGDLGRVGNFSFNLWLRVTDGIVSDRNFFVRDESVERGSVENPHDPRDVIPSWSNHIADLFNEERTGSPCYRNMDELKMILAEQVAIALDFKREFLALKRLS
jgi:hypothetical protein